MYLLGDAPTTPKITRLAHFVNLSLVAKSLSNLCVPLFRPASARRPITMLALKFERAEIKRENKATIELYYCSHLSLGYKTDTGKILTELRSAFGLFWPHKSFCCASIMNTSIVFS